MQQLTIEKTMDKNNFTEFEKTLLADMNRRAMLIVKTEEFLQEQKISFNKEILYGLPDDTLRDLCENWNPENQKNRRKNVKSETLRPGNHTINGSLAKDKVSQLTFKDQLDIMSRILNDVAADYQFDINSPDYLGFLNCSPIDDNWPEIERYVMAVFLSREMAILDTMLEERGLDIEAGADLEEIIFIERK